METNLQFAICNSQFAIPSRETAAVGSERLCRVLIDPAAPGTWNMAVDEALLQAALSRQECSVRWYQWSAATVSLGYFQDAGFPAAHPPLRGLPFVRRLSGGGAILHHHELTYSCAVPALHPLAREPHGIYIAVHEQIIATLARFGINVTLRGETHAERTGEFLCFARGDAFDVILDGFKVLGSAQRRRKGAILQHGSLVLRRSEHAPQFPGLYDLTHGRLDTRQLLEALANAMGRIFHPTIDYVPLSPADFALADTLARTRYATLDRH